MEGCTAMGRRLLALARPWPWRPPPARAEARTSPSTRRTAAAAAATAPSWPPSAPQPDQLDPHQTTAYASFQVLENVYDTLVVPDPDNVGEFLPSLAERVGDQRGRPRPGPSRSATTSRSTTARRSTRPTSSTRSTASSTRSCRTPTSSPTSTTSPPPTPPPSSSRSSAADAPTCSTTSATTRARRSCPRAPPTTSTSPPRPTAPGRSSSTASGADGITLERVRRLLGRGARASTSVEFRFISEPTTAADRPADRRDRLDRQRARRSRSRSWRADDVRSSQVPSVDYWYMAHQLRQAAVRPARGARGRSPWPSTARPSPRPPSSAWPHVNQTAIPEESVWYYDYAPSSATSTRRRRLLDEAGVERPDDGPHGHRRVPRDRRGRPGHRGQPRGRSASRSRSRPSSSAPGSTARRQGDFDAFMLGWLGNLDPYGYYHCSTPARARTTTRATATRETDALLNQAATEIDQDARKDLYDQAAERIVDANSYIYLYNPEVRAGAGRRTSRATSSGPTGPSTSRRESDSPRRSWMRPVRRVLVAPRAGGPGGGRAVRRQHRSSSRSSTWCRATRCAWRSAPGSTRTPTTPCAPAVGPRPAAGRAVLHWLGNALHRRPGRQLPVGPSRSPSLILERLPATMSLAFGAIVVALLIALPLGLISALRPRSVRRLRGHVRQPGRHLDPRLLAGDRGHPGVRATLGWLPSGGYVPLDRGPGRVVPAPVLPAVAVGVVSGSILTRFVRSSALEALGPGLHPHRPGQGPARRGWCCGATCCATRSSRSSR